MSGHKSGYKIGQGPWNFNTWVQDRLTPMYQNFMDLVHELCPVQLLEVTKKSDNLSGWITSIQHLAHMYCVRHLSCPLPVIGQLELLWTRSANHRSLQLRSLRQSEDKYLSCSNNKRCIIYNLSGIMRPFRLLQRSVHILS